MQGFMYTSINIPGIFMYVCICGQENHKYNRAYTAIPVKANMTECNKKAAIVLLSLSEHTNGIWITRLKEELESLGERVEVIALESMLNDDLLSALVSSAKLIVNRVSDAADPHLYKACMGVLISIFPTKVWNGPISYAQCGNKWCHHKLLERASLRTPVSTRISPVTKGNVQHACHQLQQKGNDFPFLVKPNAGGFGAGIIKITNEEELSTLMALSTLPDPVALIQAYVPPSHNQLYRIWFLRGKVQCGIVRTNQEGVDEFTTGCAGKGVCSWQDVRKAQPILFAMNIPIEIISEIEDRLLPLLPDAHSGSVEFLQDGNGDRLYFDVNLLSTLPLFETVENVQDVWGKEYNPWYELAASVVEYSNCN